MSESKRERLLAELKIWEEQDFTKELYYYIQNEIERVGTIIEGAVRNKNYPAAHEQIGYRDALRIVKSFGREWVEENSDD